MHSINHWVSEGLLAMGVKMSGRISKTMEVKRHRVKAAKAAYEAYCISTGNKSFLGGELLKWEALPEKIQLAWYKAAEAANIVHDFKFE